MAEQESPGRSRADDPLLILAQANSYSFGYNVTPKKPMRQLLGYGISYRNMLRNVWIDADGRAFACCREEDPNDR